MPEWEEKFNDECRKIQGWYDKKQKPDPSYFCNDQNPPKSEDTSTSGLSKEKQEAIMSNIASLAEFIPGIGSAISKGLTVVNMFLKPQESEVKSKDVQEMIRAVNQVETNLKAFIDDEVYLKQDGFLTAIGTKIRLYEKQGLFGKTTSDDFNDIKRAFDVLEKYTGSADTDNSFTSVLEQVRKKYKYGDTKRLMLLLGLMSLYGQCMLLQCVLSANMSVIFQATGNAQEARRCRRGFASKLDAMRIFMQDQISTIKPWIAEQKRMRLSAVPDVNWLYTDAKGECMGMKGFKPGQAIAQVGLYYKNERKKIGGNTWYNTGGNPVGGTGGSYVPSGTETNHVWAFDDTASDRHWRIDVREFNTSGRNYQPECDNCSRVLKTWKQFYVDKLIENTEEQFRAVEDAMAAWSTLSTKLGEYVQTLDKTNTQTINGVDFYKRMSATISGEEQRRQQAIKAAEDLFA